MQWSHSVVVVTACAALACGGGHQTPSTDAENTPPADEMASETGSPAQPMPVDAATPTPGVAPENQTETGPSPPGAAAADPDALDELGDAATPMLVAPDPEESMATTPAPQVPGDASAPLAVEADGGAVNTLVLDQNTLSFGFQPYATTSPGEIVAFGLGITGFAPEAGLCVHQYWTDITMKGTCFATPDVELVASSAEDCWSDPNRDFSPNVDVQTAEGCFQMDEDLVDTRLDVDSELFTGRIVADNRAGRVSFGLKIVTSEEQSHFVQANSSTQEQPWVQGYYEGEPTSFFETYGTPGCDNPPLTMNLGAPTMPDPSNWVWSLDTELLTVWDASIGVADAGGCEIRRSAPSGRYSVELCFSDEYLHDDTGQHVTNPICVSLDFTLPTRMVLATATPDGTLVSNTQVQ